MHERTSTDPTSFRHRYGVALVLFVLLPCVFAIGYVARTGEELLTTVLTVPVLIVAGLTLWQALPKPAQLVLVRQDELKLDDLIFFVVPQPNPANEQQVPRDYLLQLHVAVCNVGDKKAVLSRVRLEGFRSPERDPLRLPDSPTWLDGEQWSQQLGWVNGQLYHQKSGHRPRTFSTGTMSSRFGSEVDEVSIGRNIGHSMSCGACTMRYSVRSRMPTGTWRGDAGKRSSPSHSRSRSRFSNRTAMYRPLRT
jgi:hypothetical protein